MLQSVIRLKSVTRRMESGGAEQDGDLEVMFLDMRAVEKRELQ